MTIGSEDASDGYCTWLRQTYQQQETDGRPREEEERGNLSWLTRAERVLLDLQPGSSDQYRSNGDSPYAE